MHLLKVQRQVLLIITIKQETARPERLLLRQFPFSFYHVTIKCLELRSTLCDGRISEQNILKPQYLSSSQQLDKPETVTSAF